MYKILALLGIPAVVLFFLIWKSDFDIPPIESVTEKNVLSNVPNPNTLGVSTSKDQSIGWETLTLKSLGLALKIPPGLNLTEKENSIGLDSPQVSLFITKKPLPEKETVNTQAEKDIDAKISETESSFDLSENIAPVAIGSVTGITYSAIEGGKETTYFYVPTGDSFIYVQNKTDHQDAEGLSVSDGIIYSLELLPDF